MNHLKNIPAFLIAFVLIIALSSCDKDEKINIEQLPNAGQFFIKDHFAGQKVISITKEEEAMEGIEYEARLDNGVVVTFDKDGNWTEVDAPDNVSLPTTFIVDSIVDYVGSEYPNIGINSIDKVNRGFDVELTNDVDLEFDRDGKIFKQNW